MGKGKSWLVLVVGLALFAGGFPAHVRAAEAVDQGVEASDEVNEAAQNIVRQFLRTLQQAMNNMEKRVVEEGREPIQERERQERTLEKGTPDENLDRIFFLDRVDELGLSPAQVEKLKKYRAEYQRDRIRLEAELRIARLELEELLENDWRLEEAERLIRRAYQVQGDMEFRRLRAMRESLDILTTKQKESLPRLK
jgi:hypothetical protein